MHSKTGRASLLPINAHRSGELDAIIERTAQPTGPIFVSHKGAESQAAGAVDAAGTLADELIHLVKDLWRSTLNPRDRLANR
ncbi:hypothetical protein CIP107555_01889 [Corynebacterium diphtheriae]|nr:hypothetical protein CIP107555_01889 [Corynebacterium diphtheriae]VEJ66374.1 Uncharacterised protein [Corynebacterium diphtheriae]